MNLVWFRNDLRVDDNPALYYAMADQEAPTLAVYLCFSEQWSDYGIGRNQQALISQALVNLKQRLAKLKVPLLVIEAKRFSEAPQQLKDLCHQFDVTQLFFNIEYPHDERVRDRAVVNALGEQISCHRYAGDSLVAPWKVINGQGEGYKVFSAFARQVHGLIDSQPVENLPVPHKKHQSNYALVDESSLPVVDFLTQNSSVKLPDIREASVLKQLQNFCEGALSDYAMARDFPAISGTSQLSSALALGTISVRRCYELARNSGVEKARTWHSELIWRDFYRSVVWHYPRVCKGKAFNPIDNAINWSYSSKELALWQEGKTGVPIVDAAMRQLVTTGWMHNRLRMVVASYLTKNLFIDWRLGERFFAQHLLDYDFASNNGGWQWSASVGTDAAPYFRVFNPASQQKRFDPDGEFIKRWLPSLAESKVSAIHKFESTQLPDYPKLQVDLKLSRKMAIECFKNAKLTSQIS